MFKGILINKDDNGSPTIKPSTTACCRMGMPMHTPDSLMREEHLHAVGFFKTEHHPSEGPLRAMAIPGCWSTTQPEITRHAPRHGEHSVEILRELGYDEERIRQLLAAGVTLDGTPSAAAEKASP